MQLSTTTLSTQTGLRVQGLPLRVGVQCFPGLKSLWGALFGIDALIITNVISWGFSYQVQCCFGKMH